MSRFDRCRICDYNEQDGSIYSDQAPHRSNRVRKYGDDMLCDECASISSDALAEMEYYDEEEEETEDEEE